jgi:hypothetical protein
VSLTHGSVAWQKKLPPTSKYTVANSYFSTTNPNRSWDIIRTASAPLSSDPLQRATSPTTLISDMNESSCSQQWQIHRGALQP